MRSTIPSTSKPGPRASSPAYEVYMRITCLEMERARRSAERTAAAQRIAAIDHRVQAIEREKASLLARLVELETQPGEPKRDGAAAAVAGGFRIRY